jgi:hypothetical protein
MSDAVAAQMQAKKNLTYWETKKTKADQKKSILLAEQETIETEFTVRNTTVGLPIDPKRVYLQNWTRLATSEWEKVDNTRTVNFLQKEVDSLEAKIREGEKACVKSSDRFFFSN